MEPSGLVPLMWFECKTECKTECQRRSSLGGLCWKTDVKLMRLFISTVRILSQLVNRTFVILNTSDTGKKKTFRCVLLFRLSHPESTQFSPDHY